MEGEEKVSFYDRHKLKILKTLKTESHTKALWRKLFWTTAKNSDQFKVGCVEILKVHFPNVFTILTNDN